MLPQFCQCNVQVDTVTISYMYGSVDLQWLPRSNEVVADLTYFAVRNSVSQQIPR